jgi:hypothetical protein
MHDRYRLKGGRAMQQLLHRGEDSRLAGVHSRMKLAIIALGLSVAGCSVTGESIKQDAHGNNADGGKSSSNDSSKTAGVESGSRLKARFQKGSDGSKAFAGWRDTERDEDCSFMKTGDGRAHCLPTAAYAISYFSDQNCTQPLVMTSKGCNPPGYAYEQQAAACTGGGVAGLRKVGGRFTGQTVYTGNATRCTGMAASSLTGTYDLYALGEKLSLDDFVSAEDTTDN